MERGIVLNTRVDFDVVVVGGGPSGAISALKCAQLGLKVLLMEKEENAHKPCGGLLTSACKSVLWNLLREEVPRKVMCSPPVLSVCCALTDDLRDCGYVKGYELLNVNRLLFDQWLRLLASESGVNIWYGAEFQKLLGSEPIRIVAKRNNRIVNVTAKYLIGADGVYSRVRSRLYSGVKVDVAPVLQEYWKAEGNFEDCFYVFWGGKLTSAYGYVIPKNGLTVVGILVPGGNKAAVSERVDNLKKRLSENFSFKPYVLEKSEIWGVPYGFTFEGEGNIVLVGDAAGFCNTLTGEGIKIAIESAIAASNSVKEALCNDKTLALVYRENLSEIRRFLHRVHQLAVDLKDEERRQFVDFLFKYK